MKDTILWLQLPQRSKPKGNCLYSSISDIPQWIERTKKLKTGERARLYFSLLVEVNSLDIPVQDRLEFLEYLHEPIIKLVEKLSKKYLGCGLPLGEEKSKYVDLVNAFWIEMASGYKIIIDDLSDSNFVTSIIRQKDLVSAVSYVLYYLIHQLYYNYLLYADCNVDVWRDIHQLFHFASKRNIATKTIKSHNTIPLTINEYYRKILLFSLANPYHLSSIEMNFLWHKLDEWVKFTHIVLSDDKVLEKQPPFLIKPYSDLPPFSNPRNNGNIASSDTILRDNSFEFLWGIETKKLLKHLNKKVPSSEVSVYLSNRLQRTWSGNNFRNDQRNELIEPVVIALGVSSISKFLSEIDHSPKILLLNDEEKHEIEPNPSVYLTYQAFLTDESQNGFRIKLNIDPDRAILPKIGEIIAIKHFDESVHTGYLRWIHENKDGDIECGIEHLSSMAESVQLTTEELLARKKIKDTSDNTYVLDSFVFPGTKENHFKPILFTHSFVEKFYNFKKEHLKLIHKTGSINIKLTQKVDEVLDYSLYLFEKAEIQESKEQSTKEQKTAQFESMWDKI